MTKRRDEQLYTQFCIGVELGDDNLVKDLVARGANTMVSYGVDGVITTPMHSALKRGDVPMVVALLTSRSTRVRLADLDEAPRVKRELMTPVVTQRIANALEDGAREMLLDREITVVKGKRKPVKVSIPESVIEHLKSDPNESSEDEVRASPTDKPRCPPPELLDDTSDEEIEVKSFASSAEDSSDKEVS
jgi:hypothetical protein